MSGETEKQESGWTTDTLKYLMDERKEHAKDLRTADQRAILLALKRNDDHFEQLNENAKRTIEERSHFVTKEAFGPFRDQVLEYISSSKGQAKGTDITIGKIVLALGVSSTILGIVVLLANKVFS